jgi:hypothetical protein
MPFSRNRVFPRVTRFFGPDYFPSFFPDSPLFPYPARLKSGTGFQTCHSEL